MTDLSSDQKGHCTTDCITFIVLRVCAHDFNSKSLTISNIETILSFYGIHLSVYDCMDNPEPGNATRTTHTVHELQTRYKPCTNFNNDFKISSEGTGKTNIKIKMLS